MSTTLSSKNLGNLALVLLLAACAPPGPTPETLKKRSNLRHQWFESCLRLAPIGPAQTKYNDWAEVISECDSAAYYQSQGAVPNE